MREIGILPDREIERLAREAEMISPFVAGSVKRGGVSCGLSSYGYDLTLGDQFMAYEPTGKPIAPGDDASRAMREEKAEEFVLEPHGFVLAHTVEWLKMPADVTGIIHDKSTYARLGCALQNTVIEAGWEGQITLEITNHNARPVVLRAGCGIAQIVFHRGGPCRSPYSARSGKYQGQSGVTPPR